MDRTTTTNALLACLPPVSYDRSGTQIGIEFGVVASLIDNAATRADALLTEQQPDSTASALVDWERQYGLPDPCLGSAATLAQRRTSLLAALPGVGNLSIAHILEIAEALGYPDCTITEYGGMCCEDACDSAVCGEDFVGVWRLNVPTATTITTATCASPCDAALRSWGNTQLECVIDRRKPAHTVALFGYASDE